MGWRCTRITLDKTKGERIVLFKPPIVKRFENIDVFTMLTENNTVEHFNYKNWSNKNIVPPDYTFAVANYSKVLPKENQWSYPEKM